MDKLIEKRDNFKKAREVKKVGKELWAIQLPKEKRTHLYSTKFLKRIKILR